MKEISLDCFKKTYRKFDDMFDDAMLTMFWEHMSKAIRDFNINCPPYFFAQILYESNYFRRTEESFSYSEKRLLEVFPKYFNANNVRRFLGKPKKIASLVYGGRMGNRPYPSHDGWTYRGRGFIQLTGKNNYRQFTASKKIPDHMDFEKYPHFVSEHFYMTVAGWYFEENKISKELSFEEVTRIINGGLHGFKQREKILKEIFKHQKEEDREALLQKKKEEREKIPVKQFNWKLYASFAGVLALFALVYYLWRL